MRTIRLDTGQLLPDVTDRAALSQICELFHRVAGAVGQRIGRSAAANRRAVPVMPLPALENYIKGLLAAAPATQQRFLESAMGEAPRDGRVLTALWMCIRTRACMGRRWPARCQRIRCSIAARDSTSRCR